MSPTAEHLASWVSRLVQIPSVNPIHQGPSSGVIGERALAEYLAETFHRLGASDVVLDEVVDGRPNVYATFPGRSDRLVVLDVHTDTVTVENMTDPPFDGRIEDGFVWGRGALDTKASLGVICALLETWKASNLQPEPTLLVVGTVGEEAGGLQGAYRFRRWAEHRNYDIDQLIVCEPTQLAPIHGHKGAIGIRVTVIGESAHSATPERGRNAIFAAGRLITALEAHSEELVAIPPTTEVGPATLLVSMINGGIAGNVVPDRCVLTVGRRVAPGEKVQQVYGELVDLVRDACPLPVEIEPIYVTPDGLPGSSAFYQTPDTSLVRLLSDTVGVAPATAPFGTNALRYDGFARQKVIFGPGNIEDAHRPTECVAIADLLQTAAAFTAWLNPG